MTDSHTAPPSTEWTAVLEHVGDRDAPFSRAWMTCPSCSPHRTNGTQFDPARFVVVARCSPRATFYADSLVKRTRQAYDNVFCAVCNVKAEPAVLVKKDDSTTFFRRMRGRSKSES